MVCKISVFFFRVVTQQHRFKLFLEPRALREGTADPRLPSLPVSIMSHMADSPSKLTVMVEQQSGKAAINLIVDFLSCLWDYAKQRITQEIGAVADLGESAKRDFS